MSNNLNIVEKFGTEVVGHDSVYYTSKYESRHFDPITISIGLGIFILGTWSTSFLKASGSTFGKKFSERIIEKYNEWKKRKASDDAKEMENAIENLNEAIRQIIMLQKGNSDDLEKAEKMAFKTTEDWLKSNYFPKEVSNKILINVKEYIKLLLEKEYQNDSKQ